MIDKNITYRLRSDTRAAAEIIADPWVRIYATDAGGLFPVHGAFFEEGINSQLDLIEAVPLVERWAVIRKSDNGVMQYFKTGKEAIEIFGHTPSEYRIVRLREVEP